ncbi:B-box zinc finger protein 22-like [Chenopodium quinoa]|uniref:B-box zinc finger protein 22-like n=1 Tax=Chenopodium quinoa TaxID=63459 RepID=UPI000B784124|nr:B-box zinc finger protein 22-like [Chenopodium quinoa]
MKIQCNVCETAEATVLCCADEAALCHDCDEKVHAANKLASKHQRVSLSNSSSHMPNCDICQETVGYFFCLEDRALLCRKCDISIHTANAFVSTHQRFLLTGVKVGLEPTEPGSSSSVGKSHSGEKVSDGENRATLKRSAPASTTTEYAKADPVQRGIEALMPSKRSMTKLVASEFPKIQPVQSSALEDITQSRMTVAGGSAAGTLPQWPMDEFLGLNDFQLNYGFPDNGSSKADSGKLGDSDSSILRSIEDDLDSDDRLGQVPDVSWTVPQVPSPPTASGLYWPKSSQHMVDNAVFVPDICWPQGPNYFQ